jgi:lauroyl/myristoyl acyltransferase
MTLAPIMNARRGVPPAFVPLVVRRRHRQLWGDAAYRAYAEAQMTYLLEHTERASEISELAPRYAEQMLLRAYLRWHPRAITRQPVRGIEWLTTKRDTSRGVILSFAHHHRYDGLFGSLARHGAGLTMVAAPEMLAADAPAAWRQHIAVVRRGGVLVPASLGTEALTDLVRGGAIVAIASDVPGRSPVTFLGRRVRGSFGAARIAAMADCPVVLVTSHRDEHGSHLQVHEPLEPGDHRDPGDLLVEMLRRHEQAVLAWPEAFDSPDARFGELASV